MDILKGLMIIGSAFTLWGFGVFGYAISQGNFDEALLIAFPCVISVYALKQTLDIQKKGE